MNSTVVLRRNLRSVGRLCAAQARISSFVDLDVPTSYRLPLALLPPIGVSTHSRDVSQALQGSFHHFQGHSIRKDVAIICHVDSIPKDIGDHERGTVFTSRVASHDTSTSRNLQESSPQANSEPPKPEKPKWEDEQYPDIGKSRTHALQD